MSYDIVLVMVPPWEPRIAPLGLAYIAEYLRANGLKPKILDFNLELYRNIPPEKRIFWEISNINSMHPTEITLKMLKAFQEEIDDLIDKIFSIDCGIIGFSVNIASIGLAAKIASLIKKRDKKKVIIFGGTGCFWDCDRRLIFPEDLWAIDAFVIGEGEIPLEKIIINYKNNRNFDQIEGVISRSKDFLKSAVSFYQSNIDNLPFPTFRDFNLDLYNERVIPMLISRGCIGHCAFCIDYLMCGRYRYRSPEKILEEIKYHINFNKISMFSFNDLICNGNLKQLERICDLIIESKLEIIWGSYALIRRDMNYELLKKMHKAGCFYLCYGLENGSNRILKRMNKFYTQEEAQELIRATHDAGIRASINIIVGFPGEREEDFEETLAFIRENKKYIYEVTNVSSFVVMVPARVGRYPQEFGITLPPSGKDNNLYVDANGVTLEERMRRVRKAVYLISCLGINNAIVNQPGLKTCIDKETVALVLCPPARTDLPSLRLADLYSYLRFKKIKSIIYDFNIKLFNIIPEETKRFWEYANWHLWSIKHGLSEILNSIGREIFILSDELYSLPTNTFCFLVTPENFCLSSKIATLLKKYNPNLYIIFSDPIFEKETIFELIPQGVVDIFIYREEKSTLFKILSNQGKKEEIANTITYKNGVYQRQEEEFIYEKSLYSLDFSGFDLKAYSSLKLPLSFMAR